MKRSTKKGLAAVLLSATLSLGGAGLATMKTTAETAVDYMENLQDLSYTTTVYGEEITLKYRLWLPENYDESVEYPMITMLHGHGGQGSDNTTQLNVFKPLLSKMTTVETQASDPCILLIPQCRADHKWVEVSHWTGHYSLETFAISPDLQAVVNLQDEIMQTYSVDENRQCVTGHSMGGLATWDLISRFPDRYAAAMPISGAGNDMNAAQDLAKVNIWAVHGALDPVVGADVSRDMVSALKNAGGWVRYTEYPDKDHSVGVYAYQTEEDVKDFFLSARRGVKSGYVESTSAEQAENVAGSDKFWFYNSAPAANSNAARDYNGKHYASFDALSVNLPSATVESKLINLNFPFERTDLTQEDGAIRIRMQTIVPSIANEALRFDLKGSSTLYMTTNSTVYLAEGGATANLTVSGSGAGAAVNVVSGASASAPKLIDGYLILPVSIWGESVTDITSLNIRTNMQYAKNIWNFGAIEYGSYRNGTFTASRTLWSAFDQNGDANAFTADDGVDAVRVKANTFTGTTESVWLKSSWDSITGKIDLSVHDGLRFYVDNSGGKAKKSFQIYMFSTETEETKCAPAQGWMTKNGLAYFKPDADCTAFKNSFAYRSSFVPAGFKGEIYIPLSVNAAVTDSGKDTSEAGCFERRENAPAAFPTEVYNTFLVYFENVQGETLTMQNRGLVADGAEFMQAAFGTTAAVNLATDHANAVMVQSNNRLASQFEFWVANKSGVFFAEGNETNEEFLGGSALAVAIENLNASPFLFSVKTWNNLGDITMLGGNIADGTVKFVSAEGAVQSLPIRSGYVSIPANAKGTLVLPYVGAREVTASVGGSTTYALGYPVKHVFRLIFNAFDHTGDASYLIGTVAVVTGDGTYREIAVDGTGIAELAAGTEDGVWKKERQNVAYSGAVKAYHVSHTAHAGATITENISSAVYGSQVVFTVSGLAAGDSVIGATLNGTDVTELLVFAGGAYTFTTTAKSDLTFAVTLDSDPKDCAVTVIAGDHGTASEQNGILKEGTQFSVTFTADEHYRISSVTVNGTDVTDTLEEGSLTVTITADTRIEVVFAPVEYTVTYELGGGVNAAENPLAFHAESEAFTLLPAEREGYLFDGWYAGEERVESISAERLGNLTLTAKWSKRTYTIGYEINANQGSVSPATMQASYGDQIEYTVTANEGYAIDVIKVNGTAVAHENGVFTVTVTENVTLSVTFKENTQKPPVEDGKDDENGGRGCNSQVGGVAIGTLCLSAAAVALAAVLRKKKEQ